MLSVDEIKNTIFNGNAIDVLKKIPSDSIDTIVTSPPYFGLRNYQTSSYIWDNKLDCNHDWIEFKKSCSGGEGYKQDTNSQGSWFERVVSYCKKCGAFHGELGLEPFFEDKTMDGVTFRGYISHLCDIINELKRILKQEGSFFLNIGDSYYTDGANTSPFNQELSPKSLCMIPQRVSIRMIENGWILRNNIVWHKINSFPNYANDRFSYDWENVFFFTKNQKYYHRSMCEPISNSDSTFDGLNQETRIMRSVWGLPIKPFSAKSVGIKDADHFAAFPPKLVERILLASCPKGGVVFDPFMGSGTTAVVAKKMGLEWSGIELSGDYCNIILRRLEVETFECNAKIVPIGENNLKATKTCRNCSKPDCMLREFGDMCPQWQPS